VPAPRKRRPRLPEYEAKRDFAVTPEPSPAAAPSAFAKPGEARSFMVHKHHARRLHYDLRLEMDGALASWAVPKGPSYDPSVRRMAVQTEDHPLAYGAFEGRIPDGEYGAGDSLVWDRGTYDTVPPGQASEQRKKGHLHLELRGEKLRGRWHLVRTGGRGAKAGTKSQWLLFKAKDEAADPGYDVVAARPESVVSGRVAARGPETAASLRGKHAAPEELLERVFPPMLATLAPELPADLDEWWIELKYDGFRALAGLANGRVALRSRNSLDLAPRFPRVARALSRIVVAEAVVDGEVVALDEQGAPRFQLLQQGHEESIVLFAFDLLWLDGEDLRARPIEERRDLLQSLLSNAPPELRIAERLRAAAKALQSAAERGYEGVVCKRRRSLYEGTRSKQWLKVKAQNEQELAIVGFTPHSKGLREIGALLLGVFEDGGFRYVGKVGTGFTAAQRGELLRTLSRDALPRTKSPPVKGAPRMRDATWVEPKLVAQVRFTEWTSDDRLRHPAFLGLRDDKRPEECVRERPSTDASPVEKPAPSSNKTHASIEVKLTNPDRVYWPRDGLTKQDLVDYYEALSGPLLRALADRPVTLQRYPSGIDGQSFYNQDIERDAEPWMRAVDTPQSHARKATVRHLLVDRRETLRWLGQRGALVIHMWSSRVPHLESPDWVIFDLDPAEGRGIEQCLEPALALRRLFDELALPSFVKTTGKRGLHVLVPLARGHSHDDAIGFAVAVGTAVARLLPDVTVERAKAKRRGRLYLDCFQNGYGKTIVAPYSPRPVDGAPVSAPLAWSEVTPALDPASFNLRTMPERLAKVGDLFAPVLETGVRLPKVR